MMILEVGGIYIAIYLWLKGSMSIGTVVLIQVYLAAFSEAFGISAKPSPNFPKLLPTLQKWSEFLKLFPASLTTEIARLAR